MLLLKAAQVAVDAIRTGCQMIGEAKATVDKVKKAGKEAQSIVADVSGFFGFIGKLFGAKPKAPQPVAEVVEEPAEKKVKKTAQMRELETIADIGKNLSTFFRLREQMAEQIRQAEEKSRHVYDPDANEAERAMERVIAESQMEMLETEIRELMVYHSPPVLRDLYTRVNKMRMVIRDEQELARLEKEQREREAAWRRRAEQEAIQDKVLYAVAVLIVVAYLTLFFYLLVEDRKVRWGF